MGVHESATIRTVRFHDYGEPADVLRMDRVGVPDPGPDRIRVNVHACGLNPADWALCRGLFPGVLPRGIGLELSGTVDTVGPGVADVAAGDLVLGMADYAGGTSAAAAQRDECAARPALPGPASGICQVRHRHRSRDGPDHRMPGQGTRSGAPRRAGPPDLRYPTRTASGPVTCAGRGDRRSGTGTGTGAGAGLRPGQMGYRVGSVVYWRPEGAVRRKVAGVICSTFQPGCCLSRWS
jgi:hypothetical protein